MSNPKAVTKVGYLFGGLAACYVLDNGQRVMSQRGQVNALTATYDEKGAKTGGAKDGKLDRLLARLPKRFAYLQVGPNIAFETIEGGDANGRTARQFVDICNAYVDAGLSGELRADQMHLAMNARRIVAAAASVSIEAMIDEATGYEPVEGDTIATRFIKELFRADPTEWKRFWPQDVVDEFCRTFRLQRSQSFPAPMLGIIGKLYETKLGREAHQELKETNPRGPERSMHHQHFGDRLYDALRSDMQVIKALLMVSSSKDQFWDLWSSYCTGRGQMRLGW